VWRRRVCAEEQARDQAETYKTSNVPRRLRHAPVESAPGKCIRVTAEEAVTAVDGGAIVKIGNDQDIGLVISRAGFDPAFKLTCVIGSAKVCVPNTATDLQTTELVDQKDIDYTGHRIAAINSRRAILQDVDVIDHWKGNEIDVHAADSHESRSNRSDCNAFSIDQNQRLLGEQTAQIRYNAAIAIPDVLIESPANLLR
jgi:hypothetical protein